MRKIKTLGLAAIMVLAFGASLGVASASASTGVYIDGGEKPKFDTEYYTQFSNTRNSSALWFRFFGDSAMGTCSTNQMTAEIPYATSVMFMTMNYSGCSSGEGSVTVNMNECYIRHDLKTQLNSTEFEGTERVAFCPDGKGIQFIKMLGGIKICTATIANGTELESWYRNSGTGSERNIGNTYGAEGIEYTLSSIYGAEGCGKSTGIRHDGVLAGGLTIANNSL